MAALSDDLTALRGLLWESLQEAPAAQRAGLAREYRETLRQLAEVSEPAATEETGLDEFTAFAQQRKTSPAGGTGPSSG